MFTSRAEHRLTLRQDNTFFRLANKSRSHGLISENLYQSIKNEEKIILETIDSLKKGKNSELLLQLLGHDQANKDRLAQATNNQLSERALNEVWSTIRYEPYLKREEREIERAQHYQLMKVPEALDFSQISGLSKELQQKLNKYKPKTIAQAMQITGITPAAIIVLIFPLREKNEGKKCNS
jgi:tRNA uridine 5-carboxymethylaminomethyl modification enzyme